MTGLVPLIYASHYNISAFGLEHLHPFDGRKFSKIQKHLIRAGLRKPADFVKPLELSKEQLLKVHTSEYLESLKDSGVIASILEVFAASIVPSPLLDWRILHPMRLAGGGTLIACRLALQSGLAINLGGGYHHAERNHGGGFCVYSDVPIAVTLLRQEGLIGKILIIDTDAHQGNGFANVLRDTGWAHILDLFDESIYPFPKVLEDISVPLRAHTDGNGYLTALEKAVPKAISRFQPDLIVYNAGSDVLASDPLSSLKVSPEEMCQRDLFVVSQCRERRIPLAMVLAGGYSRESASAHGRSIEGILAKYDSCHT
jgi:histone deacetylase 11